jgi:hypothetical protein
MRIAFAFVLLSSIATADDRSIQVIPSKSLPQIESVSIYRSADLKPGQARPKPLASAKEPKDATTLAVPSEAVTVFVKPKGGIDVPVADKLTVKAGAVHVLKLGDLLGVVDVFQKDGFPKIDRIVLTAPDDPGPDEKGHVAIQSAADYRDEMLVPEGFYAVWLVPANGARAQRIEDRIRVLPGKIVRIGN